MATYAIGILGTTYTGNTSTFTPTTIYTPVAEVAQGGTLAIVFGGAYDTRGLTGNGVNISDFGLLVGAPLDPNGNTRAGETLWGTNTAILDAFLDPSLKTGIVAPGLDGVTQTFDPQTGVLRTVIDPVVAPQTVHDFFLLRDGDATPRKIIGGEVVLDFSEDFGTVNGTAAFYSVGAGGTFAETLQFSGFTLG